MTHSNKDDVRSKTISFAVTEEMYSWIKHISKQVGSKPSSFVYDWLKHSFDDEIKRHKQER